MRKKITVVGAGMVGGTLAQRLAERNYADVVVVDIVEGLPQGKALDIQEAAAIYGYDARLIGANSYDVTAGSDIVVITSGMPRRPGMTRDDLLLHNTGIVRAVAQQIVKHAPDAFVIVVSNPHDAMTQLVHDATGFPKHRVMGMAGTLDSARFAAFIAEEVGVSIKDVHATVLGAHGDTMLPLARYSTVAGVPITALLTPERITALEERVRAAGDEVSGLLKSGSAFVAPSAATLELIDAIMLDQKRVLPVCAYLEGEFGISGLFVGVPARIGAGGVESIFEVALSEAERQTLDRSADTLRDLLGKMRAQA